MLHPIQRLRAKQTPTIRYLDKEVLHLPIRSPEYQNLVGYQKRPSKKERKQLGKLDQFIDSLHNDSNFETTTNRSVNISVVHDNNFQYNSRQSHTYADVQKELQNSQIPMQQQYNYRSPLTNSMYPVQSFTTPIHDYLPNPQQKQFVQSAPINLQQYRPKFMQYQQNSDFLPQQQQAIPTQQIRQVQVFSPSQQPQFQQQQFQSPTNQNQQYYFQSSQNYTSPPHTQQNYQVFHSDSASPPMVTVPAQQSPQTPEFLSPGSGVNRGPQNVVASPIQKQQAISHQQQEQLENIYNEATEQELSAPQFERKQHRKRVVHKVADDFVYAEAPLAPVNLYDPNQKSTLSDLSVLSNSNLSVVAHSRRQLERQFSPVDRRFLEAQEKMFAAQIYDRQPDYNGGLSFQVEVVDRRRTQKAERSGEEDEYEYEYEEYEGYEEASEY